MHGGGGIAAASIIPFADRCYFQPVVASFEKPVGAAESSAGYVAFLASHVPACDPAVMSTSQNCEPEFEPDSKQTPPAVSGPTLTSVGSRPPAAALAWEL